MNKSYITSGVLLALVFLYGVNLLSSSVNATSSSTPADSIIDEINITVPISCTLTGVGMDTHNAEISNGQINSAIGETTMKAYCNDKDGFGIYAIGYTDDIDGKNVLTNSAIDPVNDIVTGTATGPVSNVDTSNWAMKLSTITSPTPTYPIAIQNNYNSFHRVPEYYELVAKRDTANDVGENAEGSTFKTTYQAYISNSQLAGTYVGQVKYTLVHPSTNYVSAFDITYNANTEDTVTDLPAEQLGESTNGVATLSSTKPVREGYGFYGWCTTVPTGPNCSGTTYRAGKDYPIAENSTNQVTLYAIWGTYSELDTGKNVNAKMKSLAAGTSMAYNDNSDDIKAIRMASSLPTGFTPSTENTISVSEIPTYIWYDNTNDAGIMYVYTSADKVRLGNDSSSLFLDHTALTDISGVASWDTQNATKMGNLCYGTTNLSNISPLADWDTSSVTTLMFAFKDATGISNTNALANWDISEVASMFGLFEGATSLYDISGLSNWDTSNVTSMSLLFHGATSLSNISPLANWDTSKVKSISSLFRESTSLTDISALSNWDTSNITSMSSLFRGATSLSDISPLAHWKTSSLTGLNSAFRYMPNLSDISALSSWNTSKVINMTELFWNDPKLVDLSPLSEWDTSNVTDMSLMFGLYNETKANNAITDLTPLANWDVGKVTTMDAMFQNVNIASLEPLHDWDVGSVSNFNYMFNQAGNNSSALTNLAGLEDWDVSNALYVGYMFGWQRNLVNVSTINDWNIINVVATAGDETADNNYFYHMFIGSPIHPDFTKRVGTWNNDGTFIPSS